MAEPDVNFSYCSAESKVPADSGPLPPSNLGTQEGRPGFLAANKNLWWKSGTKLKVRFLNGTSVQKSKVKYYINTYKEGWERYAHIDFRFLDDLSSEKSDINVGFHWNNDPGTWSYVGRQAQLFTQVNPKAVTVNFGDLNDSSREEEWCRLVLHEFGHAIGCVHEHQANPIEWNTAQVIADCEAKYGWNAKQTREQIIEKEDFRFLERTDFDPNSIMCYWFPARWTVNNIAAPLNVTLSTTDKSFISKIYPFQTRNEGELAIDPQIRPWYPPVALNTKAIAFSPHYLAAPNMVVGLKMLDIANSANIRVRAAATRITTSEFDLTIDSWADTQLFNAAATWIEFTGSDSDYQIGEYNTLDTRPLNQFPSPDKDRVRRDTEHFDFPDGQYTEPPNVVVWLSALDMAKGHNWRVKAHATNITASGFDLNIDTWEDTIMYGATASWVAYPKGREGVASGRASSSQIRNWFPATDRDSKKIKFPAKLFDKAPKVFLAISELDLDSAHNLRVKVSADKVDASGFTWLAESWADSNMFNVGTDWIAFG